MWYKFIEWSINKKLLNGDRRVNLLWLYKKYLEARLIDLQPRLYTFWYTKFFPSLLYYTCNSDSFDSIINPTVWLSLFVLLIIHK